MTEEKKKSKKGLLIALAVLLVAAIGANIFQFVTGKPETSTESSNNELVDEAVSETDSLINSLEMERDMAVNHIDSIEMELSFWKQEVENVKQQASGSSLSNNERNRLLGRISSLRNRIAAFASKEQLLDSFSSKNLAYELELSKRNDSIAKIIKQVDNLTTNVQSLTSSNQDLNDKITAAGQPIFSSLNIFGTDEKKSGNRTSFDASKIENLKLEYSLIGNSIFKGSQDEELKVKLFGPKGELYQQGGAIIEKPRSSDYTFIENLKYTGQSQQYKYSLKPLKKFPKGKYNVELYENDQLARRGTITLY